MPAVVTRLLLAIVAIGAAWSSGKTPPRETAALNAAISYRRWWLEDTTRFDACSAYIAAGRPSDFPAGIHEPGRVLLGTAGPHCSRERLSPPADTARRVVLVDSLALSDSTGRMTVTVRTRIGTHRETYDLIADTGGRVWFVTNAHLWGHIETSPPPR